MVIDPLELLGKRIDFQIHIVGCLGVKWLKEDATRGIQMGYITCTHHLCGSWWEEPYFFSVFLFAQLQNSCFLHQVEKPHGSPHY